MCVYLVYFAAPLAAYRVAAAASSSWLGVASWFCGAAPTRFDVAPPLLSVDSFFLGAALGCFGAALVGTLGSVALELGLSARCFLMG